MKNLTKAAVLSAAIALLTHGAYAASGDLILGFTGNSGNTDLTIDLGSIANLPTGSAIALPDGLLSFSTTGLMLGLGSGGNTVGTAVDFSVSRTGSNAHGSQGTESTPSPSGSANSVATAAGLAESLTIGSSANDAANSFSLNLENPITTSGVGATFANSIGVIPASSTGSSVSLDIFTESVGPKSGLKNTVVGPTFVGELDLSLSSSSGGDTAEFFPEVSAVPEPSTYGLLGGAGLLLLCVRRQFNRANA